MIRVTLIPNKNDLNISIQIPDDYLGKPVHVLIYKDEEVVSIPPHTTNKPSDFFGTLSKEEGEKMQKYVSKSRKEWERDI